MRWFLALSAFAAVALTSALGQAEFRKWTAAAGGFQTEAELTAVRDGVVVLRLKDGTERKVPLEKLSTADQQYAQQQANKLATPKNARREKLERDAARFVSAEDRLRLYKIFCQDPETTDEDRQAVAEHMLQLRELAEQHKVWMRGSGSRSRISRRFATKPTR